MIYRGHVRQGTVVFDQPTGLPDGLLVQVQVVDSAEATGGVAEPPSLYDRLQDRIGHAPDLPADDQGRHQMTSVKQVARVLPGHRVEIVAPELPEGEVVDVVVTPRTVPSDPAKSIIAFVQSLPVGPRAFASWDDYEQHLQQERDAWDR